jgi:ribonuclease E
LTEGSIGTDTTVADADQAATRQGGRERRSRDRYGRDRRPRNEHTDASTDAGAEADVATLAPVVTAAENPSEVAGNPPRSSYFNRAAVAAPVVNTDVAAPAPATPVAEAIAVAPVAAPTPAPAVVAAAPFVLDVGALAGVAEAAGLQWVQSDNDRVAQVQATIAAEPKPVHVPREPKPVVLLDEGPLVLVETRKDLREMVLPFER